MNPNWPCWLKIDLNWAQIDTKMGFKMVPKWNQIDPKRITTSIPTYHQSETKWILNVSQHWPQHTTTLPRRARRAKRAEWGITSVTHAHTLPTNACRCLSTLANLLNLNALPVHTLRQVPKNVNSVREVLTFWVPYWTSNRWPQLDAQIRPK